MKGQLIFGILLLGAHFGLSFPNEYQRIINGKLADAKEFPYQVFYDVLDLSNLQMPIKWKPKCGGTLISKRIILTAAHCFDNPNIYAIKIYFGAVNRSNNSEIGQQQLVVKRANVVVHEDYDASFLNDIAIIKFPVDIAFDEYIKPAKLPQADIVYSNEAFASGWGAIETNGTEIYDPKLRHSNLTILSHAECKKRLKRHFLVSSKICVAPSENPTCMGDSGGPLAVKHDKDIVLLGITSYGITRNCTNEFPEVFTRVASYLNWIHENAGAHNLEV
ncbi:hypothetical protein KR032_005220 [Drosophila birchii]|nr:hypothetical protein KR032_005220 [Drosophila birchii]